MYDLINSNQYKTLDTITFNQISIVVSEDSTKSKHYYFVINNDFIVSRIGTLPQPMYVSSDELIINLKRIILDFIYTTDIDYNETNKLIWDLNIITRFLNAYASL
jgi:hypothetical protein